MQSGETHREPPLNGKIFFFVANQGKNFDWKKDGLNYAMRKN